MCTHGGGGGGGGCYSARLSLTVPVAYMDLTRQICGCVKWAWKAAFSFPMVCISQNTRLSTASAAVCQGQWALTGMALTSPTCNLTSRLPFGPSMSPHVFLMLGILGWSLLPAPGLTCAEPDCVSCNDQLGLFVWWAYTEHLFLPDVAAQASKHCLHHSSLGKKQPAQTQMKIPNLIQVILVPTSTFF